MNYKLIETGDGDGTLLLPIPTSILKQLGWKSGDSVAIEIPTPYPDQIIVYKRETL